MQYDTRIALSFQALAHPRRVKIFRILAENPEAGRSFLSLQQSSAMAQSSFTHHVRVMERCGLINRRWHRGRVQYTLTPSALHMALLEAGRLGKPKTSLRSRAA